MAVGPIRRALRALANPARAEGAARYFQAGPGGTAEGDRFLGVAVPALRRLARAHRDAPFHEIAGLLSSRAHEERLLALLILVEQGRRAEPREVGRIARFYLDHLDQVDNWDLVDSSAPHIIGPYLASRPRGLLDRLARSTDPWRRRVAMVTTQHFIRQGDVADAFRLAARLGRDENDLVQKAAGWMLREAGEKNPARLRAFLARHGAALRRVSLRSAVEKLPPRERARWLGARAPAGQARARQERTRRGKKGSPRPVPGQPLRRRGPST